MQSNIKKDYFWNTLGVVAQNAISPLLLIVITRLNGIDGSGLFSFAFSVAIIFWALGMWGGRTYQVSDVRREFPHRSYIIVRLLLAVGMLVGVVAFSLINHYDATKSGVLFALVLFKVVESISDSVYGILQVHGHLYVAGKSLTAKAIMGFAAFVAVDALSGSILLGSLAIVLVNAIIMFGYDIPRARSLEDIHMPLNRLASYARRALDIMWRCAPAFGVLFLTMFPLNIPRYFLDTYHPDQIGYFGILAMPLTLIVLLVSLMMQPNIVNLSVAHDRKELTSFRKTVMKFLGGTLIIGILTLAVSAAVGVPLLNLVFGVDFSNYWLVLVVMIIGAIANALVSVFINVLIVMRRFRAQFNLLLVTNLLLAVISVVVVHGSGILGAAFMFMAVSVVQAVLLAWLYEVSLKRITDAKEN